MRNRKGQSVVEMVFVLPLLVLMAGGMIFMVYTGWQDLKLQQAANLLARVEGQEKVSGGTSMNSITQENGFGSGTTSIEADSNVGDNTFDVSANTHITSGTGSVMTRLRNLLRALFPEGLGKGGGMDQPRSGQNVDQISLTKVIPLVKLPFMKGAASLPDQITLQGKAYGGEDPYMYALPRWGHTATSGQDPEWRRLLSSAKDPSQNP